MRTLLFLGGSITDANRNWKPETHGLGDGYVSMIARSLSDAAPEFRIINKGHDGFTVRAVLRTLNHDCISNSPDLVTILVGSNDVGVSMNTRVTLDMQDFSTNYDLLIHRVLTETDARIICMAPFIFPHPQEYALWIPEILHAERLIRETAAKYSLPFIPLHERLNTEAKAYGYEEITTDGVHLTERGHHLLADLWLGAFRVSFEDFVKGRKESK